MELRVDILTKGLPVKNIVYLISNLGIINIQSRT